MKTYQINNLTNKASPVATLDDFLRFAECSTVRESEAITVLILLQGFLKEYLSQGYRIKLPYLGTFYKGKTEATAKRIHYLPDKKIKAHIKHL